jgi:mannose-6-phosphate isomerase-like protein (cupin superfamily)
MRTKTEKMRPNGQISPNLVTLCDALHSAAAFKTLLLRNSNETVAHAHYVIGKQASRHLTKSRPKIFVVISGKDVSSAHKTSV